ncbi:MAG: hypothetical protein PVG79_17000, partial [Gemmatimonadales bacterium]|jgi:hypothetical protein
MRLVLAGLVATSLIFSGAVQAQDFSGTYTVTNDAGGTVTLTLAQDAQGQVTGTLSAPGVRYDVNGVVDEGSVLGTVSNEMGGLYFAAEFDGGQLYMTLFEPDAYNQPNYDTGQTIVFNRAGGAQPAPAPQPTPAPPAAAAPTGGADIQTGLPIAFGLPRIVAVNTYLSRSMVVEAVYQATYLSGGAQMGRIVNTGTLAVGPAGVQYAPHPSDRLVVNLGDQSHEFVVMQAQGNQQAQTASAWVAYPHILQYSHKIPGMAEATIAAQYDGSRFQVQVQGWTMQSGTRYDVNMQASGVAASSSGYHGGGSQIEYDMTGRITGGGLEIDVNEHHTSVMQSATNLRLLHRMRGSASQTNATINNVLRMGGVEYRLQNVQVQTEVRERGFEGSAGLTGLQGELLRAGQPFGRFFAQGGRAFVETASGTIALDTPPGGAGR